MTFLSHNDIHTSALEASLVCPPLRTPSLDVPECPFRQEAPLLHQEEAALAR
jgi:hypothetical protein